jgi:hypothetical protein
MSVIINGETGINKIQDFTIIESPVFTGTVVGVTKTMVGLSNVDNTTDVNKPVSSATQTALNLKANLSSPDLIGTPTAPTPTAGDNSTKISTTAFVKQQGYLTSALQDTAHSFSGNGYQRLSNGWIIQWGSFAQYGNNDGNTKQYFPIAFPNAVFSLTAQNGYNSPISTSNFNMGCYLQRPLSLDGFYIDAENGELFTYYYIVIGY